MSYSLRELADLIRERRAERSDAEIRESLLAEGCSKEQLDAGFELADESPAPAAADDEPAHAQGYEQPPDADPEAGLKTTLHALLVLCAVGILLLAIVGARYILPKKISESLGYGDPLENRPAAAAPAAATPAPAKPL